MLATGRVDVVSRCGRRRRYRAAMECARFSLLLFIFFAFFLSPSEYCSPGVARSVLSSRSSLDRFVCFVFIVRSLSLAFVLARSIVIIFLNAFYYFRCWNDLSTNRNYFYLLSTLYVYFYTRINHCSKKKSKTPNSVLAL